MRNDKIKKITLIALLSALALIFSYIESLVSLGFIFPGFKIGISNITVLVVLYLLGEKYAVPFGLCKSFFSLLFLGRLYSLCFSVCGMAMSLFIMILLRKTKKFSTTSQASFTKIKQSSWNFSQTIWKSYATKWRSRILKPSNP